MNKIGKVSGQDWNKAPEGTTHVKMRVDGSTKPLNVIWYKQTSSGGLCFDYSSWTESAEWGTSAYKFIPKNEDLIMKQVRSFKDLETGMFVHFENGDSAYVHISIYKKITFAFTSGEGVLNDTMTKYYTNFNYDFNECFNILSWSWSLKGEKYLVSASPTPEQVKIAELEKSIAEASKQLQELKDLSK